MWIKVAIVVVLLIIVVSLFSALFFLSKDKGTGDRTVKALTVRISLSIALFIIILAAYHLGYIGQQ
jgi:Mn2+/Fe2+ NRAMP family transporter